MREPHESLTAFLGDLHEQCLVFRQSTRDPFVHLILTHVQLMLTSSGIVVSIDERDRARNPEKR